MSSKNRAFWDTHFDCRTLTCSASPCHRISWPPHARMPLPCTSARHWCRQTPGTCPSPTAPSTDLLRSRRDDICGARAGDSGSVAGATRWRVVRLLYLDTAARHLFASGDRRVHRVARTLNPNPELPASAQSAAARSAGAEGEGGNTNPEPRTWNIEFSEVMPFCHRT